MRQFRDFEIRRLNKIVENSREQTEEMRGLEAHHHRMVCHTVDIS